MARLPEAPEHELEGRCILGASMRIALLYPPPWKIAERGQAPIGPPEGPPHDYREGDLDADFYQTPYGLFSLGAQALRAGHRVKVVNLSAFPWARVEEVLAALDADLYGMSCWTANRRGVALAARSLRRHHPGAPSAPCPAGGRPAAASPWRPARCPAPPPAPTSWSAPRTPPRSPPRCSPPPPRSPPSVSARASRPSSSSSTAWPRAGPPPAS